MMQLANIQTKELSKCTLALHFSVMDQKEVPEPMWEATKRSSEMNGHTRD